MTPLGAGRGCELNHRGEASPNKRSKCIDIANSWCRLHHRSSVENMLRPASWTGLAGGSPVPVSTGAPGSRPRFVVARRRAKRGVESLFGGSKCAGRSVVRRESCSLVTGTTKEPSRSCHGEGPCPSSPGPGSARRVLPGYGERHVHIVQSGTGEARLPGLRRAKTRGISRW